jgi:hypothetical protein
LHVLLDKNVPYGTRHFLHKHKVETVDDRGWACIPNGDLIRTAEAAGFDVVITADQNIVYQQNLKERRIALVIIGSNIWPIVRSHAAEITSQVEAARPGSYVFIEMPIPRISRESPREQ